MISFFGGKLLIDGTKALIIVIVTFVYSIIVAIIDEKYGCYAHSPKK